MKKIYKYRLPEAPGVVTTINERIIEVLSVQYQNGIPTIWVVVDPDDTSVAAEIMSFGTGWELPNGAEKYVGSLQDPEGYVWHYFIVKLQEMKKQIDYTEALAVLAQALGKIGISAEEAGQAAQNAFSMEGLFDACM